MSRRGGGDGGPLTRPEWCGCHTPPSFGSPLAFAASVVLGYLFQRGARRFVPRRIVEGRYRGRAATIRGRLRWPCVHDHSHRGRRKRPRGGIRVTGVDDLCEQRGRDVCAAWTVGASTRFTLSTPLVPGWHVLAPPAGSIGWRDGAQPGAHPAIGPLRGTNRVSTPFTRHPGVDTRRDGAPIRLKVWVKRLY